MNNSKVQLGARILLGLIFAIFGANGFLNFIPPQPMADAAGAFAGALFNTGYMFPLIKSIEVVVGILLLTGIQVPFALLLLAPIAVNIFLFHFILAGPATSGLAIFILVLIGVLAYGNWNRYAPIFKKS